MLKLRQTGYIAYVDEAGDDGIRAIRSQGQTGASEWMVISAFVVRAANETKTIEWVAGAREALDQRQGTQIHFRNLRDDKKLALCEYVAGLDARLFAVLSNKRNMQGYRNDAAASSQVNATARFYCWMTRLLFERVTSYCGRRTNKDYGEERPIKFELAHRGGVDLRGIRRYYAYLRSQSRLGILHNKVRDLDWRVMDPERIEGYAAAERAGLQLADVVASAFFAGVELTSAGMTRPEFAKALAPRVCRDGQRRQAGYGVTVFPKGIVARLPECQADVLRHYGCT